MLTPVESCAQTLDLLFEQTFQDMDAVLQRRSDMDPEAAADITSAVEILREFYPDAVQMLLDGASNVRHRVREISDCVKGIVAEPAFELVDARTIAQQVYQPAAMVADRAGVTLRLELPEDLPPAYLDEKRIYNAIYNLVNNAIPETPAGGTVTIRLGTCAARGSSTPDRLLIEVSDTGRGMPEAVRRRLFTDEVVSTKPGGTGLGTRIVKSAVGVHGGEITVESEEGRGSTFTMVLPLAPDG